MLYRKYNIERVKRATFDLESETRIRSQRQSHSLKSRTSQYWFYLIFHARARPRYETQQYTRIRRHNMCEHNRNISPKTRRRDEISAETCQNGHPRSVLLRLIWFRALFRADFFFVYFLFLFIIYYCLFFRACAYLLFILTVEISGAENERYRPLFVPRMPYSTNFRRCIFFQRRFICSGFVFMYGYLLSRVLFLRLWIFTDLLRPVVSLHYFPRFDWNRLAFVPRKEPISKNQFCLTEVFLFYFH